MWKKFGEYVPTSRQIARGILNFSTSPLGLCLCLLVHDCQLTYISQIWEKKMLTMASYLITTYCMIGIEWSEKHEKWSYKNYNFYMVIFFQLCSFGIENMIVSGPSYLTHFEWVWWTMLEKKVWCPSLICSLSLYMVFCLTPKVSHSGVVFPKQIMYPL